MPPLSDNESTFLEENKRLFWYFDIRETIELILSMAITGICRDDAMMRQITEAVHINNIDRNALINTKA